MEKQVGQLCKSAWLYLYKINKIEQYLTTDQVETIVHAFVTTKLDLNNSLLAGLPGYIIHRLQLVQNAAAKTVADLKKFDHVTHVLQNLNWLPVEKRIMFKLLLLCYKALNGAGPVYLKEGLSSLNPKDLGFAQRMIFYILKGHILDSSLLGIVLLVLPLLTCGTDCH